ncbi:HAD family hydrolase [Cohnella sp.]|uniref:HAD family hydrolase n=1 Tax=Cohnella sp. TaxID=1883426 RepID=UPI00356420A5
MGEYPVKGIIFDMDNTLLRSRIDFGRMKQEIYAYLQDRDLLPEQASIDRETSSTLIRQALATNRMAPRQVNEVWAIAAKHETEGMAGADLEPDVREMLEEWKGKVVLALLTNNSIFAARAALEENRILHVFDLVVGREDAGEMKPSPDGVRLILNRYPRLTPRDWISVGDAWIDCKASQDAGVRFIAYRADMEKMRRAGTIPEDSIARLAELSRVIQST